MTDVIMATDADLLTSSQNLLVEHLERFGTVKVMLQVRSLKAASDEHPILLACCNLEEMVAALEPRVRSKVFALNRVQTLTIAEDLEPLQLAGSLDLITEAQWARNAATRDPEAKGARGIFGRRDVAVAIGADVSPIPNPSVHYGFLTSKHHRGIPELIWDYLRNL